MVKVIIILLLVLILLSLAASLFSIVKTDGHSDSTIKFLTWRIGLSILAFVFIIFSFFMGWIQPHGILPPGN